MGREKEPAKDNKCGHALLENLGREEFLRIFVDDGSNQGHQSASVTLARKLIARFASVHVDPALRIEFLCKSQESVDKVKKIIGGDQLERIPVTVDLPRTLVYRRPVTFCFSGAVDRPEEAFAIIKAKYFVGLQPIGWAGGPEAVLKSGEPGILSDGPPSVTVLARGNGQRAVSGVVALPLPFERLPFLETAVVRGRFAPSTLQDRVAWHVLERAAADRELALCPIYGIGSGQPMESSATEVLCNLGAALLAVALKTGRRVVLVNLSLDAGGSNAASRWGTVARRLGARACVESDPLTSVGAIDRLLEAKAPFSVCTIGGFKSYAVMDRAYRESALPPMFEGQGSLTQVLPMGRAFLKYSARACVDRNWPSDYQMLPDFPNIDVQLQRLVNTLVDDWSSVTTSDPRGSLVHLLLATLDADSEVNRYFRAAAKLAGDPVNDRLAWAAQALYDRLDAGDMPSRERQTRRREVERYVDAIAQQ